MPRCSIAGSQTGRATSASRPSVERLRCWGRGQRGSSSATSTTRTRGSRSRGLVLAVIAGRSRSACRRASPRSGRSRTGVAAGRAARRRSPRAWAEEVWRGERHREDAGDDAVDIADDVGPSWRVHDAPFGAQVRRDESLDVVVRDGRRVRRLLRRRSGRIMGEEHRRSLGPECVVDRLGDPDAVPSMERLAERHRSPRRQPQGRRSSAVARMKSTAVSASFTACDRPRRACRHPAPAA